MGNKADHSQKRFSDKGSNQNSKDKCFNCGGKGDQSPDYPLKDKVQSALSATCSGTNLGNARNKQMPLTNKNVIP